MDTQETAKASLSITIEYLLPTPSTDAPVKVAIPINSLQWSMKPNKIIRVGNAYTKQSQCGNIYGLKGISPAINCGQKRYGGLSPFILVIYEPC